MGELLPHCLRVACFLACLQLEAYVGTFHGLGNGVTTAGWDVESLDGLLIMLAFEVACLPQM